MRHTESSLQIACMTWINLQHPKAMAFHVPNGGRRDAVTGARLKREGVRRGVPDIFVPVETDKYNGLFAELKTKRGAISKEQRDMMAHLESNGYCVRVCRSVEEFIKCVEDYLKGGV